MNQYKSLLVKYLPFSSKRDILYIMCYNGLTMYNIKIMFLLFNFINIIIYVCYFLRQGFMLHQRYSLMK